MINIVLFSHVSSKEVDGLGEEAKDQHEYDDGGIIASSAPASKTQAVKKRWGVCSLFSLLQLSQNSKIMLFSGTLAVSSKNG